MSQQQLDLVATMETQLAATSATLAELKATLATDPEPPNPEPPPGIYCETADDLDAVLADVAAGTVITLSCALVYPKALTLKASVTLEAATLPEGRMTMGPMLPLFADGLTVSADDATLRGLEIRKVNHLTDIVIVTGANAILDRLRILGDPIEGAKRGLAGNAVNLTVVRCYVDECFQSYPGSDSQAILIWDTPGPALIEDNYLCAGSETIMIGGGDPSCEANVPTDITIRGNTITANPSWQDKAIGVKSRLELKNAKHVLIEDNDVSQSWGGHGQDGYLLSLTVRNQDGHAPYSTIEHVIIRHNHFHHAAAAINLLGEDDNHDSGRMTDIEITNNEFTDLDPTAYTGSVKMMLCGRGPLQMTIGANTFDAKGHTSTLYFHSATPQCEEFHVVDNTWPATKYGIFGSGMPAGVSAWDYYVASGSCEGNEVVPA